MNIDPITITEFLMAAARENANLGRHQIAIGLFEQALRKLERSGGPENMRLASILADLSDCYDAIGHQLQARQCRDRLSALLFARTRADEAAS